MIKLKDILFEDIRLYAIDIVIVSDKTANFTDILDNIRATRKVTIVNANTPENVEEKNRVRTDGKEVHTATLKFVAGKDPKQDIQFFKTTMLSSDKGDPERRIEGLRHIIFKEDTLVRI